MQHALGILTLDVDRRPAAGDAAKPFPLLKGMGDAQLLDQRGFALPAFAGK